MVQNFKRQHFRPNQFAKKTSELTSVANDFEVHHVQSAELEKLKIACQKLHSHWKTPLKAFDLVARKNFDTLSHFIGTYKNHPEAYLAVYEVIHAQFGDLITANQIEAGTLSGYISSCVIEKQFSTQKVNCVEETLPLLGPTATASNTATTAQKACTTQFPIMMAVLSDGVYTFHLIQDNPTHRTNTIICVNSMDVFFSEEEKKALKDYHIEKVNLVMFENNQYKEINGGFLAIDALPKKSDSKVPKTADARLPTGTVGNNSSTSQGTAKSGVFIFLLIALIFVGLFVAWRYSKNN